MAHKFGKISYINSVPLFCARFGFDCGFTVANPGELNALCAAGELDLSMISLWAYADIKGAYKILPNYCIAGDGEVKSVLLFSDFPLEELKGKRIYITKESKSSVSAFRAYCLERHSFDPYENASENIEDADAVFLIGNPALAFDKSKFKHVFDFGLLWKEHFALPLLYSVAVIKNEYFDELKAPLSEAFAESLKIFEENRNAYCASSAASFPNGEMDIKAVSDYYDSLIYRLTDADFAKCLGIAKKYGAF